MAGEILTTTQRNALFALMAEAREIANKELETRYGVSLTGQQRLMLNEWELVSSKRVGRGYVHELLDDGWVRCREELAAARTPRGNIALYAVLTGLDRYLKRTGNALADVFAKESVDEVSQSGPASARPKVDEAIVDAYQDLAERPGAHVKLTALRTRLTDHSARQVTNALRRMASAGILVLTPEEDQKRLKKADRDAAVRFGDQENHMVSFEAP